MNGRYLFKKFKILIVPIVYILRILPNWLVFFLWDSISIFGGKIFVGIRYLIIKAKAKNVGDNVYTGKYVVLKNIQNLKIGSNVSIHDFCYIDAAGDIEIGNNVSIAHNSTILSAEHTWEDQEMPIKYNKVKLLPTILEDDIWVGCGVRILGGVSVKKRSIVASGAIVNKSIEENSLVGGVPAKLIKKINE